MRINKNGGIFYGGLLLLSRIRHGFYYFFMLFVMTFLTWPVIVLIFSSSSKLWHIILFHGFPLSATSLTHERSGALFYLSSSQTGWWEDPREAWQRPSGVVCVCTYGEVRDGGGNDVAVAHKNMRITVLFELFLFTEDRLSRSTSAVYLQPKKIWRPGWRSEFRWTDTVLYLWCRLILSPSLLSFKVNSCCFSRRLWRRMFFFFVISNSSYTLLKNRFFFMRALYIFVCVQRACEI